MIKILTEITTSAIVLYCHLRMGLLGKIQKARLLSVALCARTFRLMVCVLEVCITRSIIRFCIHNLLDTKFYGIHLHILLDNFTSSRRQSDYGTI